MFVHLFSKAYEDLVDALILRSANVNLKNKKGRGPLHVAVRWESKGIFLKNQKSVQSIHELKLSFFRSKREDCRSKSSHKESYRQRRNCESKR